MKFPYVESFFAEIARNLKKLENNKFIKIIIDQPMKAIISGPRIVYENSHKIKGNFIKKIQQIAFFSGINSILNEVYLDRSEALTSKNGRNFKNYSIEIKF